LNIFLKLLQSTNSEFPLTVGIYIFTNQPKEIQNILQKCLGFPAVMSNFIFVNHLAADGFQILRSIFSNKLFSKQKLADIALSLLESANDVN
jgi:hypothetical protein